MSTVEPQPLPEINLQAMALTVLHWLVDRDGEDRFILDAPYQRGSVWSEDQRRALIKSLIMGIPVGVVIVAEVPYRHNPDKSYRIVDGKQRIEAVRAFVAGDFAIPGWWVASEDRLFPHMPHAYYGDLSKSWQRGFEMTTQLPGAEFRPHVRAVGKDAGGRWIWKNLTAEATLRFEAEVYGLINGAGTAQTDEDMARAARVAAG